VNRNAEGIYQQLQTRRTINGIAVISPVRDFVSNLFIFLLQPESLILHRPQLQQTSRFSNPAADS